MNYQPRSSLLLSFLMVAGCVTCVTINTASAQPMGPAQQPQQKKQQAPNNDNDNDNDNPGNDDKNPTDALFDAINTGNLTSAQDALNRGADLHAANVLGQTPLEMSIDLNRDRITFLLLSMRGYNNSPQALAAGQKEEVSSVTVKRGKGYMAISGKNKKNPHSFVASGNNTPLNNGAYAAPKPDIGFLGFQK